MLSPDDEKAVEGIDISGDTLDRFRQIKNRQINISADGGKNDLGGIPPDQKARQNLSTEDRARALVQKYMDSAFTNRELLVSLIQRVELTEEKQIIIKFRFREREAIP